MASLNTAIQQDVAASYINSKFAEQPWYKENANFITTFGGFVATVLVWAGTQPFAENPQVQFGILIIGFILTALGVKFTPNGFSKSQVAKVNKKVADHIDNTALVADTTVEQVEDFVEDTAETLAERVREFNRTREM